MNKIVLSLLLLIGLNVQAQFANDIHNYCTTNFDLTVNDAVLLQNLDPATHSVSYYLSQANATVGQSIITDPANFVSPVAMTIFARVENTQTEEVTVIPFNLILHSSIGVNLAFTLDDPSSMAYAEGYGAAPYTYQWSLNNVPIAGATSQELYILDLPPGDLSVLVTDGNGCLGTASSLINGGGTSLSLIKTGVLNGNGSVGDIITYTMTVTNTGATMVHDIIISDALTNTSLLSLSPSTLTPGMVGTAIVTYTITANDVVNGSVVNSATVQGVTGGNVITDVSDEGNPTNGSDNPTVTLLQQQNTLAEFLVATNYEDFNNDGFVNPGDILQYQYVVTNVGNVPIFNIGGYGETALQGMIAMLIPGESNSTTLSDTHVITQADLGVGAVNKHVLLKYENASNSIYAISISSTFALQISTGFRLNAFIDTNGNGFKDNNEVNFYKGTYQYEVNNDGIVHNILATSNPYIYETSMQNVYDFRFEIDSEVAAHYTSANTFYNDVTIDSFAGIATMDFPITALPFDDVAVYLYNDGMLPRPGFTYSNKILYVNNGTSVANGTITFNADGMLSIQGISEPDTTSTPSGFTCNFTDLQPGEHRIIDVSMLIPTIPTINLGYLLQNSATISMTADDSHPSNDVANLDEIVVGSYDPNDKTESHGSQIVFSDFGTDEFLTYTIRFENTGTASAINVKVIDTLEASLDETSVRMVNASADYTLDRVGSNLTWTFASIDLPPSEEGDPVKGHGYIVFQVKPKPGFQLGDDITNIASIYFDFNPAIVTEPCVSEFVPQLNVSNPSANNFSFYPNPVKDQLQLIGNQKMETVTVYSLLGQRILETHPNATQTQMNLSALSNGTYVVKIQSGNAEKIVRIIKQ